MVMRRLFGPILALFVALTPSCLGGQTGQPSSGTCEPHEGELWHGRTVAQLAQAFEGEHRASLAWREEEQPESEQETPVAFEDEVVISIDAAGAIGAVVDCQEERFIEVQVEVATTESGLSERGSGMLIVSEVEPVLTARLNFGETTLLLHAAVSQTDAAVAPQGWLLPQVAGAPGGSATFR